MTDTNESTNETEEVVDMDELANEELNENDTIETTDTNEIEPSDKE